MEQPIRQRLVGAGVILALGIILLTWIYEPVQTRSQAKLIPVAPPMPDVPALVEQERELALKLDQQAAKDRAYQIPEPVEEPEISPKPRLDEKGVPESWSLQMGVFANRDNAKALVQRLQKLGYKAYSRHWDQGGGKNMDGVYVGPMVYRKDLIKLRANLKKKVNIKGVLVRYHP